MIAGRILSRGARVVAPRASIAPRVAFRGYAAAAPDARPPVALFGLDGTYASALYTAAVKQNALDATAKALATLHQTFQSDAKLAVVLEAPSLTAKDKEQVVAELLKVSGSSDATIKNFLKTLADNNRLNVLAGVTEKFAELMSANRGEVELRITSAAPLDAKILKQLETTVSKSQYVGAGKKLKTVAKVQPDIRGGLIVEVGDRTIDLSVSSKMARMNKLLQESL